MPLLEALEREWSRPINERSPSRLEMQDQDQDLDQEPAQEDKEIVIDWDGEDDPAYPMNWPVSQKWLITITMGIMTFFITFASSIFSAATQDVADKYHVSSVVATLGTSLFVLGFAFGPLIWGPASELYGRKIPLFTGIFIFAIFQIPVGVAQNLQTIMICRFFGGVFGSAPLAIVGGALSDLWEPVSRSVAMCVFAASTFIGPILAPIVGQFLTVSYLGWRWTAWIVAIGSGASWLVAVFLIPETYAPVLLQRRAARLRIEKNNPAIHVLNERRSINLSYIVRIYLLRPFIMAAREPILDLMTIYMALIYGILYLFFEVYPVSFQEQRKWKAGIGALPFLAVFVGVLLGVIAVAINSKTRFARKMRENGGKVVPEERLPMMIVGAALFPAGLFWFAWTSNPHVSWKPQVVSGIPIGMGIMMIFLQGLNYIVDVYVFNSNSAIAANSFLRALAGAGFPLFAVAMYHNLGVDWATSLLAFLAIAMFPIPILFFIYGSRIRKLSRYSPPM